jgi:RNA polymerase sigma-70 factor, ECF subfamily
MPSMKQPTDDDLALVNLCRQGDFAAFETLVARYERRVFNLAVRMVGQQQDAEEVVQQTFLSVVEHVKDFREEALFSTWLMQIATNHALILLRKRSRRRTMHLGEDCGDNDDYHGMPRPEFIAEWRETPEQIASRHETRQLLTEALAELGEKYRLVFLLRDMEGFSTTETAEMLGVSETNVKVRLLRARLMLRERLTRVFGDEARQAVPDHEHR